MAIASCGCLEPCNCELDEDGFFSNRLSDGRRSTTTDGDGSLENPYVIHFQESEFYRPPSGELSVTPLVIANSPAGARVIDPPNATYTPTYQSPGQVFFAFPTGFDEFAAFKGTFHIVGVSGSFAANATGSRWISIGSVRPEGGSAFINAAEVQSGNASEPTFLSCSGFAPGLFDFTGVPGVTSDPRIDVFYFQVSQNSGSDLLFSNIKFWITTI